MASSPSRAAIDGYPRLIFLSPKKLQENTRWLEPFIHYAAATVCERSRPCPDTLAPPEWTVAPEWDCGAGTGQSEQLPRDGLGLGRRNADKAVVGARGPGARSSPPSPRHAPAVPGGLGLSRDRGA